MPRQTEPNANNALGGLLQDMMPRGHVRSENTQAISGQPGLRPVIIITAPGRSPVAVEAEYMPARTVEPEATSRLGLELAINGRIIEAVIALSYLYLDRNDLSTGRRCNGQILESSNVGSL